MKKVTLSLAITISKLESDKLVLKERIAELEEEKLNMQISITSVRESVGRISSFVENIEPRSHEAVMTFNQCMDICAVIDEMDLPEFKGGAE
jgi:predicted  nucleic acid-binding Zn-ribbon protein